LITNTNMDLNLLQSKGNRSVKKMNFESVGKHLLTKFYKDVYRK